MIRIACVLSLALLLAACGGGGGGGGVSSSSGSGGASNPSGGSTTTPPPVTLSNFTTLTVDAGPAALDTGPNAYTQDDVAYVSVTICAPGSTTNCQTIDHVEVDTGSVGLRIFGSVINSSLLGALPNETDTSSNPVGECYAYVDGYVFGSVRQADFTVGGEKVASMPFQVMADGGAFANAPTSCSSGGGTNLNTVQAFGANGIIGIGTTATDCGGSCEINGQSGAAIYYDCPTSGCASIIARNAATTAPFQQLPNPVAAMSTDNNGTLISLPAPASTGQASLTGTIYFGIGTQTNNGLGSAQVLTVTTSASNLGPGILTATYNGKTLDNSFLDTGSNAYYFVDSSITLCTASGFSGFYCPAAPLSLSPSLQGLNNVTASGAFTLYNAQTVLAGTNTAAPGLGVNSSQLGSGFATYPNSFDFGLPFFFGRNVYTAIEGRTAGAYTGPFVAF